jgi:predicted PurR-regulated permease PerM
MNNNQPPYYTQLSEKLLILFLIGVFVYLGHDILVPIYFSILLSILLLPVTNFIERFKVPKAIANLIAVLIALFFISIIIYFLSSQISSFATDLPSIKKHLSEHYIALQNWVKKEFHVSFNQQAAILQHAASEVKNSGGGYIGQTFSSLTETLLTAVLVTIYSFLILYYRHHIKRFLFAVFKQEHADKVQEVLTESKSMVKNYMLGLLIEMAIVAIVLSTIFLFIGIKYAVFLGVFAAILNIIPYVGIFTAAVFTVLVTLTTSLQTSDILWVAVSMALVHITDSNFLMPRIVGSKVKINALITIIGVVIGGSLIGLSGIFLALPSIAILKIIFDRVDELKPWGMLLGDEIAVTKKKNTRRKLKDNESKDS